MHLSILSDALLTNRFSDADTFGADPAPRRASRAHWDGIMRGLLLLGVFAVVIVLALLSNAAQSYETTSTAEATVPTLVFEADVPTTKIMHRLVLSHE